MATHSGPALSTSLKMISITSPMYAPQLARVKFAAFQENELNALMYPISSNNSGTISWLEERERRELTGLKSTTVVAIVNTANDDEVIACAKWKIPPRLHGVTFGGNQPRQVMTETRKDDLLPYPEGANVALQTHFRSILNEHRAKYYDPDTDYNDSEVLGSVYTHPQYQGRGCASEILQWGIRHANAVGAKIYLEASPKAHGLYAKLGWRAVDRSIIDLSDFGGRGWYSLAVMIREPEKETESVQPFP